MKALLTNRGVIESQACRPGKSYGKKKPFPMGRDDVQSIYYECMHAKWLQLCLTVCNPMDCSPPGSPVHGILQARILEWVAMPSSRGSS